MVAAASVPTKLLKRKYSAVTRHGGGAHVAFADRRQSDGVQVTPYHEHAPCCGCVALNISQRVDLRQPVVPLDARPPVDANRSTSAC